MTLWAPSYGYDAPFARRGFRPDTTVRWFGPGGRRRWPGVWWGVFLKVATASTACAGCCGRPLIQDCPSRWSRLQTPMRLRYFTPYSHAINRCTSAARHRPTPSLSISGGTLIRAWSEANCVALNLHGRPGRCPSSRPTIPCSLYHATQCLKCSRLIPYCAHTHVRLRPQHDVPYRQ